MIIDADFPGGNVILESVQGDTISVHQDLRDTEGDWFYWSFRVRGAAGRTLHVQFTKGDILAARGPAASVDGGNTWRWLGADAMHDTSFQYAVAADTAEVRFCLAIPYLEANLRQFLRQHAANQNLRPDILCATEKGRQTELLHLGHLAGGADHRVLLTCRHHACESTASYALEGLMETVLSDPDDGQWLREHVEFLVVPFVDKDGVEQGDQGKNRRPHDHNRDYAGDSIYSSVRALRQTIPEWSSGRLRVALDLHCPWIRGSGNEELHFVGGPKRDTWEQVGQLSQILEAGQTGALVYHASDNLPFGQRWNVGTGDKRSFSSWAADLPGIGLAATLEVPYANVYGQAVTVDTARSLGHDLARALRQYLPTLTTDHAAVRQGV